MKVRAVAGILYRVERITSEDKGQVQLLIAKRPPGKPYAGYWEFPGGKIEPNESSEQALKRELAEELGIEVLSATFLFTHYHIYPDKEIELHIWRIDQFAGDPEGKENQALAWTSLNEIKNYQILDGNHAFLDQLGRGLGVGWVERSEAQQEAQQ